MIHNVPQPDFEALVSRQLEGLEMEVEVRKGHSFVRMREVCCALLLPGFQLSDSLII